MNPQTKNTLLEKFIEIERNKTRAGSGDDMFYEQQVIDYINKQRGLWLDFIDYIERELRYSRNKQDD